MISLLKSDARKPFGPQLKSLATVSANPVGVVVPCHRVIGADASLTGYGGGLERKRWLLEHEGVRLPVAAAVPKVKKA